MAKIDNTKSGLKEHIKHYEYEIILLTFLLLRFVFKNILTYKKYFNEQIVFGLSEKASVIIGSVILLVVCIIIASLFGQFVRANGETYEKPVLYFVALFFACPAALPFLFDTNSLSGTQMLYPFALFIVSIILVNKPVVKWFIPIICITYFIPAVYTSIVFFDILRKGAILYVPLILFSVFLDMMKNNMEPVKKKNKSHAHESNFSILFIISCLVSAGAYILSLFHGKAYGEMLFSTNQKLNQYFIISVLIVAPALYGAFVVLYNAVKNGYTTKVLQVFIIVSLVSLMLSKNNYYGIWIPFLIISIFSLVFYSIRQKNPAILNATKNFGDYISDHRFFFYIVLIFMASFSNVSSDYLSKIFQNIFSIIPY